MVDSPRISVSLKGKFNAIQETAIVDTGYTGGAVIPLETALEIGMGKVGEGVVELADGSERVLDIFTVDVTINGVSKDTTALVMGNDVLVGMAALQPFKVCVDGDTRVATLEHASTKKISDVMKKIAGRE